MAKNKNPACSIAEFARITGVYAASIHQRMKRSENAPKIAFEFGARKYYPLNDLKKWHAEYEHKINHCLFCKSENPTYIYKQRKFCDRACSKAYENPNLDIVYFKVESELSPDIPVGTMGIAMKSVDQSFDKITKIEFDNGKTAYCSPDGMKIVKGIFRNA